MDPPCQWSKPSRRKHPKRRPPCAAKSNEITAIPRLLDRMVLEGAVHHQRRRLPEGIVQAQVPQGGEDGLQ